MSTIISTNTIAVIIIILVTIKKSNKRKCLTSQSCLLNLIQFKPVNLLGLHLPHCKYIKSECVIKLTVQNIYN